MTVEANFSAQLNNASPIISASELEASLGHANLKIIDVRGRWINPPVALIEDYEEAHIPGAVFMDWRNQFVETDVPINLAPVANFDNAKSAFQSHGINNDDLVVIYDDYNHMFASRIWWAMRYWGFKNVKVLSGSWPNWQKSGKPTSFEKPTITTGNYEPVARRELLTKIETILDIGDTALLDGRGAAGFRGKPEDPTTGRIPGAINVPFKDLQDAETGTFLPDKEMARIFDDKIPSWKTGNLISSCGGGYTGAVVLLALLHLGVEAPLFDGSFAEWKQDPERPIEQG